MSTVSNAAAAGTSASTYTYAPTTAAGTATTGAAANAANDPATAQDRFLKLLVAQLTNQDPMNPMDNAQMTSQIAQINTVTGITQLNSTVKDMASQISGMQVLQGGALVGRSVVTEGSTLTKDATAGTAGGMFELSGAAADVQVDVTTTGGVLLGTMKLGTLDAGRHEFAWDGAQAGDASTLNFAVRATNAGTAVASTALRKDTVKSVGADGGALTLTLDSGSTVAYTKVKSIL